MLETLSDPGNADRTWLYQTCTEWGFYQTCDLGSGCPYTQGLHTLSVDLDICAAAFGIPPAAVLSRVGDTNTTYGGRGIQGERILFVNGQIDPWHAASVLTPPPGSREEPTLWVPGASHHFWTHPSLPSDAPAIVQARQAIWAQVSHWLALP
jgi:serine protease 16